MNTPPIDLHDHGLFDLDAGFLGSELKAQVLRCIELNKQAVAASGYQYAENARALDNVAPDQLDALLHKDEDIHGISSDRSISNVISFNARHVDQDVQSTEVDEQRQQIDRMMAEKLQQIFASDEPLQIRASGHFWYPKASSMGWHTNSRAPGWRIYINYAEVPGESFFRYRDPASKEIITLRDKEWNVRVFRVTDTNPLWHAVYSNTNRFSFGYIVKIPQKKPGLLARVRKLLG